MTSGVGLFYGGMVRKKNFISMIALLFVALSLVSLHWVLIGFTLVFGHEIGGPIGGLEHLGLARIGVDPGEGTCPPILFAAFHLAFAAVTLAVITSAVAERIKLSSFLVLVLLWTTLVYDPLATGPGEGAGPSPSGSWTSPVAPWSRSTRASRPSPSPS